MNKNEQVEQLTRYMANFVSHIGKILPDDIIAKLDELAAQEDSPLSKTIYETMKLNQKLAAELNRPCCQDTGVLQFWVKCGAGFPLIGELEALLKEAVMISTVEAPLRHNSVETFDEYNTGKNVGKGTPTVFWDIVPDSEECEIYAYMAGGGCTLPGKAMVLMPGAGYEGVTRFVMDVMTSYGLNACPPLLVGVGVATSVETAALLSKKALMRPLGSHNENERAASMEKLLEDGINSIGLGPQGMGGKYSVMGVHIENTARHPSTIGVAVNVGCWSHRRGHIIFDKDLNYTITTQFGGDVIMVEMKNGKKILTTPVSAEDLADIHVGDIIYLNGSMTTCRDVAHRRLVEGHRELPVDVRNNAIFHAGPIIRPLENDKFEMVSVGPTTSMRMEKFEKEFVELTGVRVIIGKGGMGPNTEYACKNYKAIHCVFPAGNAVVAATEVEEIVQAEWRDLGMPETLWNCRVKEFGPLIVSIDTEGRNLFEENKVVFNERKEKAIEEICKQVSFIK
ncbi:hypothetical protein HMPREF9473_01439 [ [Hungatella hathewayi WAL-18680]|uniref:L(+)-tartrate dehydratase subunit beta n=2 Tax=Hungatella hathewayi TaxID=154046 RepID=G5ID65_9FIRM|nr:hypothetical protein HMPREF9473_01439 [ [Hungatella hathewayi WAL-18680]